MSGNKKTARRGNAGGIVNHQRREHTTTAARGARHRNKDREWRPVRLGELIGPALDSLLQAGVQS